MREMKGNRYAAFGILLVSILLGLLLIKPILMGIFWLIGWLLQGIIAIIVTAIFIVGGYCLYRVEKWAFLTLFTNKTPNFPDLSFDMPPDEDMSDF